MHIKKVTRILHSLALVLAVNSCKEPPSSTADAEQLFNPGRNIVDKKIEATAETESNSSSLPLPNADLFSTTQRIFDIITASTDLVVEEAEMKPYEVTIPKSDDASLSMVPIPGGSFTIGTSPDTPDAQQDEAPQVTVELDPFWMGQYEITWELYQNFMDNTELGHNQSGGRNKSGTRDLDGDRMTHEAPNHDTGAEITTLITQPTPPYLPMNLQMGNGYERGFPAIAMSQYAASKFCAWLSAQTGHFYRLPTEAEWEYACRAGTTTRYSFGDSAEQLGEHAFYLDNAEFNMGTGLEEYSKVGQKKPNAWGLYDMHGNVAEWTLDAYDPNFYSSLESPAKNPWNRPVSRYPRVVRGGSFLDDAEKLRSAARTPSDPSWNQQDPQIPKSIWYLTDGRFIGFRVVRPLKTPSAEEMHHYWNTGPGTPD